MKTKKEEVQKTLLNFTISKKEALSFEGGPDTDRGTVTMPATIPPT
jgi:hypothetical protein